MPLSEAVIWGEGAGREEAAHWEYLIPGHKNIANHVSVLQY